MNKRTLTIVAASGIAITGAAFAALNGDPTTIPNGGSIQVVSAAMPSPIAPSPPQATAAAIPDPTARYDWSRFDAAVAAGSTANMTVTVGTAQGELHRYTKGNAVGTNPTDLASASKWLVGTVAMRMVEAGKISLDARAQDYLDFWTKDAADPRSRVTLRQLLSLQSGFNSNPAAGGCVEVPLAFTLQSCARLIYSTRIDYSAIPGSETKGLPFSYSDPGTLFSYGPHHLQIAAAMLAVAGGKPYTELFKDYVATPLGMTQTRYAFVPEPTGVLTGPIGGGDPPNPWVAGGGESTIADYSKLLQAFLGTTFIRDVDGFTRVETLGVPHGYVPTAAKPWEYALGSFVECAPAKGSVPRNCDTGINSSPGAFGWLGWVDRTIGYYGLIAAHTPLESDAASIALEQRLKCEIGVALAHPNPTEALPPTCDTL